MQNQENKSGQIYGSSVKYEEQCRSRRRGDTRNNITKDN